MSNFEKFKEELLSKENFYSSLTDGKITNKEYENVFRVSNKFEMKAMKDYHNLYLKCYVFLLADVFEEFSRNSLKKYGLCPSYHLRSPSLSWNVMLKMTETELKLNSDPHMYIFFEKGARGKFKTRIKTYYIHRHK